MDGTATGSQLIATRPARLEGTVRFELASAHHNEELRRLLRENPMQGKISVSLEREPDYFAAGAIEGPEHQTIVAVESDRVICAGSVSARSRFINGKPMRIGYLGGLRAAESCRGQGTIIRRGFDLFRQLHEQGGPPLYLTSIISDNLRARRFLESGLKGMPTYRFLAEFVTLIIRRRPQREVKKRAASICGRLRVTCAEKRSEAVLELLNRDQQQYQLAPFWSEHELQRREFRVICSQDRTPIACAAMWDQRSFKQTVVRGYAKRLHWARPLINLGTLLKRPGLPRIGETLSHAFVSHLAVSPDQPELAELLILLLHDAALTRGIEYLTIGFDSRDRRLTHLRKVFRPREYVSRLYAVHWDDEGARLAKQLDHRLLAPEAALL